jgi:hypothetical protein
MFGVLCKIARREDWEEERSKWEQRVTENVEL